MTKEIKIGDHLLGENHPVYFTAEIGLNHNGDIDIAKRLIDASIESGCNAVKFQKRTPAVCVSAEQGKKMRETPWGYITYMEYREKVEFGEKEYLEIDTYCREKGIAWFASCWDEASIQFIEKFNPPCHKISSASLTDASLLDVLRSTGKPLILSTGMSDMEQIREAVRILGVDNLLLVHSTSSYPCPNKELNLKMIPTLIDEFDCPIGYSGHEIGLPTTVAAVALGACFVERHITLDHAMWGSDHAASVEPQGFQRLVKYVRAVEEAMGDGKKVVYSSELAVMQRLRRVDTLGTSKNK